MSVFKQDMPAGRAIGFSQKHKSARLDAERPYLTRGVKCSEAPNP